MENVSEQELIKLLIQFYGEQFTNASEDEKSKYISDFRKVESENIEEIKKYESVENWYLSGQGRIW